MMLVKKTQKPLGTQETQAALGARVREIRSALGWTQEHLANRLADAGWTVHKSGVAKVELGSRPVTVSELLTLATVLQIQSADLLPTAPRVNTTMLELRRLDREVSDLRAERADLRERIKQLDERVNDLRESRRMALAQFQHDVVASADDPDAVERMASTYLLDDDDVVEDARWTRDAAATTSSAGSVARTGTTRQRPIFSDENDDPAECAERRLADEYNRTRDLSEFDEAESEPFEMRREADRDR